MGFLRSPLILTSWENSEISFYNDAVLSHTLGSVVIIKQDGK